MTTMKNSIHDNANGLDYTLVNDHYLPNLTVQVEEPLAKHTSFRIGGPARRMAFPQNAEQLVLLLNFADQCGARPFLLGNGTNVLFPDGEVDRLIVNTRDMAGVCLSDAGRVRADAGATLARVASFACQQGLAGLEFAHGIPGTVGGGVCMNAGAYGGEMKQVLRSAAVLFPEEGIRTLSCEELNLSYRHSLLTEHPEAVVLYAEFELTPGDPEAIRAAMRELMAKRKASQPLEWPSAGSTFKRPEGYFAGRLIEEAGCKGLTVSGAQVSEKHAGFVINRGGATAADILALIQKVQTAVLEQTGVRLEPEVRIVEA